MSRRDDQSRGFSLIELLTVIAIVAILGAIIVPAVQGARKRAEVVKCASTLRSLGTGLLLYTNEHQGAFPRSWHSAGAHREPGWAISIAPYLGISDQAINGDWESVFNEYYRSPVTEATDFSIYSYALNVHFELTRHEDYIGSPQTWHRLPQIPSPSQTILLAQTRPVRFGDHFMAHMWGSVEGAKNAVLHDVYDGKAHYLFVDGSVARLPIEATFNPSQQRNLWNPSLAGTAER